MPPGASSATPVTCPALHRRVVDFLSRPAHYPQPPHSIEIIETHMSLVFVAGERVYKMKKPIRLRFIDLTTLDDRRRSCEREVRLNQRLAPGVYLGTVPVTAALDGALAFAGAGEPVEWLIVMKYLDRRQLLDQLIGRQAARPEQIDALAALLGGFYDETPRVAVSAGEWLARWQQDIDRFEAVLLRPQFGLPSDLVSVVVKAQRQFLATSGALLAERVDEGRIRDGHGDLRPEHVYFGPSILIIDRPEFDDRMRWVDPFTEIALLGIECTRLGAAWIGPRLEAGLAVRLRDHPSASLVRFYRCNQACVRALLSIEHLHDPVPRTPERWPRRAREYLDIALRAQPV